MKAEEKLKEVEEKLEKRIAGLRSTAKSCLEQRVSLGRGYKGMTDQLLDNSNNYNAQADELQITLNELRSE